MMLLPTQDTDLLEKSAEALRKRYMGYGKNHAPIVPWGNTPYQEYWRGLTKVVLRIAEKEGYHKGLPTNIDEALDSGDGVNKILVINPSASGEVEK